MRRLWVSGNMWSPRCGSRFTECNALSRDLLLLLPGAPGADGRPEEVDVAGCLNRSAKRRKPERRRAQNLPEHRCRSRLYGIENELESAFFQPGLMRCATPAGGLFTMHWYANGDKACFDKGQRYRHRTGAHTAIDRTILPGGPSGVRAKERRNWLRSGLSSTCIDPPWQQCWISKTSRAGGACSNGTFPAYRVNCRIEPERPRRLAVH